MSRRADFALRHAMDYLAGRIRYQPCQGLYPCRHTHPDCRDLEDAYALLAGLLDLVQADKRQRQAATA